MIEGPSLGSRLQLSSPSKSLRAMATRSFNEQLRKDWKLPKVTGFPIGVRSGVRIEMEKKMENEMETTQICWVILGLY